MNLKTIKNLAIEAIEEKESIFIVDLKIDTNNKIKLILDDDNGINLKECIRINRYIEDNLDREDEDFSLEVSSPDIAEPIKHIRQYNKNIGRILKIKTETSKFEGKLVKVNEDSILLVWKTREPKPIGKGKITVEKSETINFNDIKETKVKIIFN
jgi:ribosome maturation factor RimP